MARVRQLALILGLGLFGAFMTTMTVNYMLPFDPLNPEPLIDHHLLFAVVFVFICSALGITYAIASRES